MYAIRVLLKFVFFVVFVSYITFIDIYFLILNIVYSKAVAEDVLREDAAGAEWYIRREIGKVNVCEL